MDVVVNINNFLNGIVWGPIGLALLFGAGLIMTIMTKGFQFARFGHWLKHTIGAIFSNKRITAHTDKDDRSISQFQSLCTALAATIGTGNIVGVASAIISGGPGAIFWMWIMAILGMMTNFSENVLGIFYRRKNSDGEWCGGAMYYLKDGLGSKKGCAGIGAFLAVLFSAFCALASFGIGNIAQVNSIASNLDSAFHIPTWVTGIGLVLLLGLVLLGGLKRVASVAEKIVPFMAVAYIIFSIVIIAVHGSLIGASFAAIFKGAFATKAVGGGIIGYGIKQAIVWGFKRGAFSNEAGLGSSVMVHSNSNVHEPVQQGMWGVFEVFADTIVVCTMTALVVLTSGLVNLETGEVVSSAAGSALVGEAFGTLFGGFGPSFVAVAILLFAFSTVLGWSHYGTKSVEYLSKNKKVITTYRAIFCLMSFFSATMELTLAWDLSDTFNGLMMIPNLIGVIVLAPVVAKITKNYIDRRINHMDIEPILSYDAKTQMEEAKAVAAGEM